MNGMHSVDLIVAHEAELAPVGLGLACCYVLPPCRAFVAGFCGQHDVVRADWLLDQPLRVGRFTLGLVGYRLRSWESGDLRRVATSQVPEVVLQPVGEQDEVATE